VHELNRPDNYVSRVLCFPHVQCRELDERLKKLVDAGFTSLVEEGMLFLCMRVLGKGYSSIVVLAENRDYGLGALKVRRLDSRRESLIREALMLSEASKLGVAPKVFWYDADFIFMEYLNPSRCQPFTQVLTKVLEEGGLEELKILISKVFDAIYILDKKGLYHRELNRPGTHIMICGDSVRIIDWESASSVGKPSGLAQVVSFLLYRYKYSDMIRERLGVKVDLVKRKLREYKNTLSENDFEAIKLYFGLTR
jgi:putative serine/threonine protein kinase